MTGFFRMCIQVALAAFLAGSMAGPAHTQDEAMDNTRELELTALSGFPA